jgi:hypothetical protein
VKLPVNLAGAIEMMNQSGFSGGPASVIEIMLPEHFGDQKVLVLDSLMGTGVTRQGWGEETMASPAIHCPSVPHSVRHLFSRNLLSRKRILSMDACGD